MLGCCQVCRAGTLTSNYAFLAHDHQPLVGGQHKEKSMATILWILAVILVVAGIFAIFRKQVLWGVVLIVVGLLVGPGGVSIFT